VIVHYWVVQKGNIHVPSLYDGTRGATYWYWGGFNWIAYFAFVVGMSFGLPGIIANYQPQAVSQAGKDMYTLGWILTFTASAVSYSLITYFFKLRIVPPAYESVPLGYEYLGKEGRDGFFDGERDVSEGSPVLVSSPMEKGEKQDV